MVVAQSVGWLIKGCYLDSRSRSRLDKISKFQLYGINNTLQGAHINNKINPSLPVKPLYSP
jgi:hypothetical protein